MRAEQLMIGDWVLYAGEKERLKGKPIYVTGICVEIMQGSFSKEMYEVLSYGMIEPIPIDLNILDKNGWKGGAGENIRFKSPYILVKKNDVWTLHYNEARIADIRFVHELQHILRMLGCEGGFKV